eukprot:TRINITY_DN21099_c0_g1_i1.p1 TRINITY_DN21099_c0_g1~~TRINITY_DN21099_c0_g1_i1.p1  ORF type:complete len:361 (+),score=77.00 TRINITY_DN21099_c0_g1_i1:70-1152(+)
MAAQYVVTNNGQIPALPGQVQPTDFMAQRVAELTHEKASMAQELTLTKRQLQDASENIVVLEEGQVFLLQKHKQIVSDYHTKLRKAEEDSKRALEKSQAETKAALEQLSQLQQAQQPAPMMDPAKVEVAQLLGVIEDLQRAIDEKNELIDLLSAQLTDLQRQSEHGKQRIGETEAALTNARFTVSELERRLQNAAPAQPVPQQPVPPPAPQPPPPEPSHQTQPNVDIVSLTALLDRRDSERAAQLKLLSEDVSNLKAQMSIPQVPVAPVQTAMPVQTFAPSNLVPAGYGPTTTPVRNQVPGVSVLPAGVSSGQVPRTTSPRRTPSPLSRVAHLTSSDLPLRTTMALPPRARAIFSPPKPP